MIVPVFYEKNLIMGREFSGYTKLMIVVSFSLFPIKIPSLHLYSESWEIGGGLC
jgi:hypothetical protein